MSWSVQVVEKPTLAAVTLAQAKAHLKVETEDDDVLIEALIRGDTHAAEMHCGRAILDQVWSLRLGTWPEVIRLPGGVVTEIEGITYRTATGEIAALATEAFVAVLDSAPALIRPALNASWPRYMPSLDRVIVTYRVGWATVDELPDTLPTAILLLLGHLYRNREAVNVGNIINVMPMSAQMLLDQYKIYGAPC